MDSEPLAAVEDPGPIVVGHVLEGERVVPPEGLEPGEARLLPRLAAPEEGFVRQIQATDHVLKEVGVQVREVGAGLLDLLDGLLLLAAPHRRAKLLVGLAPLLQAGVVEETQEFEQHVKEPILRLRRPEPVAVDAGDRRRWRRFAGCRGRIGRGKSEGRGRVQHGLLARLLWKREALHRQVC